MKEESGKGAGRVGAVERVRGYQRLGVIRELLRGWEGDRRVSENVRVLGC
jgi:hypothetical protein